MAAWPTPQAYSKGKEENSAPGITPLDCAVRPELHKHLWPTPLAEDSESRSSHGTLLDEVRDWPTPNVPNGGRSPKQGSMSLTGMTEDGKKRQVDLQYAVRADDWSTPTCRYKETLAKVTRGANASPGGTPLLVQVSEDWRSPTSRDWKGPSAQSWRDRETGDTTPTLPDQLAAIRSGPLVQENDNTHGSRPVVLNPAWVGALMGFPVDWLDGVAPPSKRSATRSSRKSPKSSRGA